MRTVEIQVLGGDRQKKRHVFCIGIHRVIMNEFTLVGHRVYMESTFSNITNILFTNAIHIINCSRINKGAIVMY